MSRFIKVAFVSVIAAFVALGSAYPAMAEVSIRDSQASDLYVREDSPSPDQLERQFAAFWNPNISMDSKLEVTYNGAAARGELEKVMQMSTTMDFFSIQGRATGPPQISGNTMSVTVEGLMAGFPAQSTKYHFIREDGLWKYDWKKTCQEMQCQGDPDFGY